MEQRARVACRMTLAPRQPTLARASWTERPHGHQAWCLAPWVAECGALMRWRGCMAAAGAWRSSRAPSLRTWPASKAWQLRGGAPGAPEGDWRSVVQAAAAAASQLEISKLSGRESTRSMDVGTEAPLATPHTSLCKGQRTPATVARFQHKVNICQTYVESRIIQNRRFRAAAPLCRCLVGWLILQLSWI